MTCVTISIIMPSVISLNLANKEQLYSATVPIGTTVSSQTLIEFIRDFRLGGVLSDNSIPDSKLALINGGNKIQLKTVSGAVNSPTNDGQIAWYSINSLNIANEGIERINIKNRSIDGDKIDFQSLRLEHFSNDTINGLANSLAGGPLGGKVSKTGDTMSGVLTFSGSIGKIDNSQGLLGSSIDILSNSLEINNNAAYLTFHRPGVYAVKFGLDIDNKLKVGGWSLGNVSYEIINSGNFDTYGQNSLTLVQKSGSVVSGTLTFRTGSNQGFLTITPGNNNNSGKISFFNPSGLEIVSIGDLDLNNQLFKINSINNYKIEINSDLFLNKNVTILGTFTTNSLTVNQSINISGAISSSSLNIRTNVPNNTSSASVFYNGRTTRNYTIIDTIDSEFVMTNGDQIINGSKIFTNNVFSIGKINSSSVGSSNNSISTKISLENGSSTSFNNGSEISFERIDRGSGIVLTKLNIGNSANNIGLEIATNNSRLLTLNKLGDLEVYGKIFCRDQSIFIGEGANNNGQATITFNSTNNRTITIPDVGSNSNFVLTNGNQTINNTKTFTGNVFINNAAPTIYLKDNTNISSFIRCNSNIFYILRGKGVNSDEWEALNGFHPLQIRLSDNECKIGGDLYERNKRVLSVDASDFSVGSGYIKFTSGFTIQWGQNIFPNNRTQIPFPISFDNRCLAIAVTNSGPQGSFNDNAYGYPINRSNYYANTWYNGNTNFQITFIAVGY
jgi:hypothetical protein